MTAVSPVRAKHNKGTWLLWTLLVSFAAIMLFPLYWMLVTAFTPGGRAQSREFFLWPQQLTWSNVITLFESQPVAAWFFNSTVIAVFGTVLTVVVSLLAGYAFAKFRFRGRTTLFLACLITIMVPVQVTLVPSFLVVSKLQLADSIWGVILPRAAEGIAIFVARQFMLQIPDALIEAARIDGAGELRIFWRVVLPLCGPLVGVLVILVFLFRWNDFLWPLVVLQGEQNLTLPVGLSTLLTTGTFESPWGPIMVVALLALLPLLAVFLLFQRQFTQGITSTGLK